jgi:hypothetical protein
MFYIAWYDFDWFKNSIAELAPIIAQCEDVNGEEYKKVAQYIDDVTCVIRVPAEVITTGDEGTEETGYANFGIVLKDGVFKQFIEEMSRSTSYVTIEVDGQYYVVIDH